MKPKLKNIEALTFEEHSEKYESKIRLVTVQKLLKKYSNDLSAKDKKELSNLINPFKL